MRFGNLQIFTYMVWLLPLLAVFYIWALRKERRAMEAFAQKELIPGIAPSYRKDPRVLRSLLSIAALGLMILALARPQWGFYWREDERKGVDILIAIDTSKSMLAVDMLPDRLSFSKKSVESFLRELKGDRVGLIAFSGNAFLQCPLTVDYSGFLIALKDMGVDTISRGGTSIPAAVEEAVRSYKGAETNNRAMIIITDGENTEGDLDKAIAQARKAGIMVSCVGIGTAEGNPIPVLDEKGRKTFLRDKQGKIVRSRLMEGALKAIAEGTGGIYVRASQTDFGLDTIYRERLDKLEKRKTEEKKVKVYRERFQYPLALALVFLIAEILLERK